jgi:hypothetical protein
MIRMMLVTLLAQVVFTSPVSAQGRTWQFRWQQGQGLTYRVEHVTSALEVVGDNTSDTKTRLNLTKHWEVLAVDAAGVATLQLTLNYLRLETTTPKGGVLLFDSSSPDKSNPEMREQLARFVGQPLAVLRVDGQGKVVEVKESKHGPASRFESEPPFVLVLPNDGPAAGQSWSRSYTITLDPPQGTGDKYQAVQRCSCKDVTAGSATVAVTTLLQTMPESMLDRVPLLQMQPEGEIMFDVQNGRLQKAALHIEKELTGHQGQGSLYRFRSSYLEEYQSEK